MKFCPICSNLLYPKKHSDELYCRICKKSFPVDKVGGSENKNVQKKLKNRNFYKKEKKRALKTMVITETKKEKSMTEEEREAFGELFELSEE
ncbi:hypothetical protein [Candidatus Harpocratesius sp.]